MADHAPLPKHLPAVPLVPLAGSRQATQPAQPMITVRVAAEVSVPAGSVEALILLGFFAAALFLVALAS